MSTDKIKNVETVSKMYESMSAKDIKKWISYWAEDGVQFIPYSPEGFPRAVESKKQLSAIYTNLLAGYGELKYTHIDIEAMDNPNKVLVRWGVDIELKGKTEHYQNELIGIFEFENGKVKRFTEYFNPLQFMKAISKTNHMEQNITQQELADKSAIEDLLIRYSYAIDFRDWNSYEQVFTKDAVIDYRAFGGPRTNVKEQIVYLKKALTPIESSQHTISTISIDLKGDTANVRCICHCPMVLKLKDGKIQVFFCGLWYNDVVVRTADGWRIKERVEQKSYIHNMPEGFEF